MSSSLTFYCWSQHAHITSATSVSRQIAQTMSLRYELACKGLGAEQAQHLVT